MFNQNLLIMSEFLENLPEGFTLIYSAIVAVAAAVGWIAKSIFGKKK